MYIIDRLYSICLGEICKKFDIREKVSKSTGYLIFITRALKRHMLQSHTY